MSIKRVRGGRATTHCHGSKKRKAIAKHKTKKAATRQHRAIMARKKK